MTLVNMLVGLPMMMLCLVIQTASAFWSVRHFVRRTDRLGDRGGFLASTRPLLSALIFMMLGNFAQILLWGVLFVMLKEFTNYHTAVYHSAVNFASLGYGDIVMSEKWKMLGALEAVVGVLMLGMTSAALMAILSQLIKVQRRVLGHEE
ncbi:potassium channel family protein [Luteolibacter arcticus]|uniref:Potassium channel family protein n=1 Tax=Luteolibacter arcticus TaxID=1581411 RepID=A0ABT3GF08_9BACT|nr:potassium channel family protein [Luteolibacter arcticus]MCW1922196.1 potassium channel family protein [Luteolibacter arcticus]